MSQPAFDFGDEPLDDATNPTYTVGELADAINDVMRRGFRDGVWVRGEIDGLSRRGPHTYFSLVEHGDDGKAVLNVQLFAPMMRNLTPLLKKNRLELANGMKVRIFGHLDFWAQGGRLGLKMAGIDPRYTLGDIAQSRDAVLRRLVADGLLDANKRRALSPIPLNVGVVTSVGSAAWHDFRDEFEASGLGFRLLVADTRVQGEVAEAMIASAIGRLSTQPNLDVIVVIRGGGARNELAVFDSDVIARLIATSPFPVLTGLGHEIDRSVADEVAHTALKTPTACAAALITRARQYLTDAEGRFDAIMRVSARVADQASTDVGELAHRIARRTHAAIERADERLGTRVDRLIGGASNATAAAGFSIERIEARIEERSRAVLEREGGRLDVARARLAAVDPAVQLSRGWSITRDDAGRIVRSVDRLDAGSTIRTQFLDGEATSTVTDVVTRRSESEVS